MENKKLHQTSRLSQNLISPRLQLITKRLPYPKEPMALLEALNQAELSRQEALTCSDTRPAISERLLLESAEIESRSHLKSLLLVKASLKIVCLNHQVTFYSLSRTGASLFTYLKASLTPSFQLLHEEEEKLIFELVKPASSNFNTVSVLEPLRKIQALQCQSSHPFAPFLGGVFGYDLIASFDNLPEVTMGANQCPDYQFYLAESLLVIDHQTEQAELIQVLSTEINPLAQQNASAKEPKENTKLTIEKLQTKTNKLQKKLTEMIQHLASKQAQAPLAQPTQSIQSQLTQTYQLEVTPSDTIFKQQIEQLQQGILQGEAFQVVPSRCFSLPCNNALASYRSLKALNPSPYMFYLQAAEFELFGASPESALKFDEQSRQVELYPIAGTRKRAHTLEGKIDYDQDSRIEFELRTDHKENAEHMMLVDLARNDLAKIALPESIYVADLLKVDRYSHVMHLVSRVVAQLAPEFDALHAYQACMNMGTLMGAPKQVAARKIRELEQQRRGSYGGAVGYLTGSGKMDTCIVIRSAFVQKGLAHIQAGAGVVAHSVPELECLETRQKAQAVIQAILQAEQAQLKSEATALQSSQANKQDSLNKEVSHAG